MVWYNSPYKGQQMSLDGGRRTQPNANSTEREDNPTEIVVKSAENKPNRMIANTINWSREIGDYTLSNPFMM